MIYPTTPPYPSVDTIEDFLDIVSGLFDRITDPWSELLFKQPVRGRIRAAWDTVKGRIANIKDEFAHLSTSLLENAGLIGPPLDLKLAAFTDALHDFLHNGTTPLLKKLVRWINILLGSLASVIPAGETLTELKEALETYIEDNNP